MTSFRTSRFKDPIAYEPWRPVRGAAEWAVPSPIQSFRLPPALAARLDTWAAQHGIRSRSGAIITALSRYLEPAPPPKTPASRRGLTTGVWR